jgi:RNA polymerase sigma-70 factor (ECF subfamily)
MRRQLVERAMAGSHDAFADLVRPMIRELYGIARLVLRDDDLGQDAVQEALVAAWSHLSALRDPDRFDAWVRRMVVRACYRQARTARRRRTIEARVTPLDTSAPDPGLVVADRDELGRLFDRLGPEQRALIVLHYHLGLGLQETSEVVGIPVGTTKSRLSRAISQMRASADADARAAFLARMQMP